MHVVHSFVALCSCRRMHGFTCMSVHFRVGLGVRVVSGVVCVRMFLCPDVRVFGCFPASLAR